jgi:transcriptional regulator with XRE-family HTH domain
MSVETNLTRWAAKIGNRLRTRRKEVGLSLTELSRLSGSTASTLSHIERGTRDVKLSTLVALTDALRIDLSHLLAPLDDLQADSKDDSVGGYDLGDD